MEKTNNNFRQIIGKIRIRIVILLILIALIIGVFLIFLFFWGSNNVKSIPPEKPAETPAEKPTLASNTNTENQQPLFQPPAVVKAVYMTSWSATKSDYIDYLINIAKNTEINSVVVDIKDWSGYVAYNTEVPEVEKYGAESIRIKDIGALIRKLHENGIYVIARITVFQDPVLAEARPDLAVRSQSKLFFSPFSFLSSSSLWLDRLGLAWIDPAAKESWDYNIAIAKDALKQGFDELNFDYVRFPSDGNLKDMIFPLWDRETPRHLIIKEFFKYLRQQLPDAKLSVDLFGLSASSADDLGVGQVIEDAFEYFDYICPMMYPSHYADGFLGFENPAEYPYQVVYYSTKRTSQRLAVFNQSQKSSAQIRPWLQDFNLRAIYDAQMVRSEIQAVYDANGENFNGFLLWSSSNFYTEDALQPESQ